MRFQGAEVLYALHPDCGVPFATATVYHSHELIEAVTDPDVTFIDPSLSPHTRPSAWIGPPGEAGDVCEGSTTSGVVAGYSVQLIWSNTSGACISSSSATIICDGSSPPIPVCRACTATDDGAACNGARPHCETDSANSRFGQCVECTQSAQCAPAYDACKKSSGVDDDTCVVTSPCTASMGCAGTTPFCDGVIHACRACVPCDCGGSTPACDDVVESERFGACVECTTADSRACAGAAKVCDPVGNTCVGCVSDADCSFHAPICDVVGRVCRACATAADCSGGGTCVTALSDPNAGRCVACTTDQQCAAPARCEANGRCMAIPDGGPPGRRAAAAAGVRCRRLRREHGRGIGAGRRRARCRPPHHRRRVRTEGRGAGRRGRHEWLVLGRRMRSGLRPATIDVVPSVPRRRRPRVEPQAPGHPGLRPACRFRSARPGGTPIPMSDRFRELKEATAAALLQGPGASTRDLRQACARGEAPDELRALLEKIDRRAYEVTDEDLTALRAVYSDDQLFEIIAAAAFGAADRRLAAGLRALEEA